MKPCENVRRLRYISERKVGAAHIIDKVVVLNPCKGVCKLVVVGVCDLLGVHIKFACGHLPFSPCLCCCESRFLVCRVELGVISGYEITALGFWNWGEVLIPGKEVRLVPDPSDAERTYQASGKRWEAPSW